MISKKIAIVLSVALFAGTVAAVQASHSWGKYHWNLSTQESTANPLVLKDNLTRPVWGASLAVASLDWNVSVLKNQIVLGSNLACDPVLGSVEVCNSAYGNTGWLGIAQIWAYRGKDGHIAQALVKVNDTYFDTAPYNTQAWKDFVMCQEVGHTFGLSHQDENFANSNIGTCMDYTNDPDGTIGGQLDNRHPNQHDYEMLESMYAHLNSPSTPGGGGKGGGKGGKNGKPAGVGAAINLNDPSAWGQAIQRDARGNTSLFSRDLGNGLSLITHVIWVK
jgi:hypothetical protein